MGRTTLSVLGPQLSTVKMLKRNGLRTRVLLWSSAVISSPLVVVGQQESTGTLFEDECSFHIDPAHHPPQRDNESSDVDSELYQTSVFRTVHERIAITDLPQGRRNIRSRYTNHMRQTFYDNPAYCASYQTRTLNHP